MLGLIMLLVFKVCSSNAVEAISGSTTTLTCPLQGSPFQWQKVVNSYWSTLQQGAKYGNVNTASLIIYNVDLTDAGNYLCRVGTQQIHIQVTVIVIAIEGSTTTLTCPLQGSSFQWLKLTNSVFSILQKSAKYGNVNTGYLAIHDVDPHDGGTYFCRTGNQELYMEIVFRAIAILGSNTTLTCTLQGSNYYWQQRTDSGWVNLTQAGNKYGNVNSGSMTIYNVQINDGGRYHCGVNSTQQQIDVTVRVNGNWSLWASWTQCTVTCDGGTRTRYRFCNNPTPINGGSPCPGLDYEAGSCSTTMSCPVNGNWGSWGSWTQCTNTCDQATRTRYRSCNNPTPINGGSPCPGLDYETCSTTISCPARFDWGWWGSWTQCTKTCDGGKRTRYRSCNNPTPINGGSPCIGLDYETALCSTTISCAVNGNWGPWQDWNSCSVTCGSGSRSRYQECNNPEPANGGSDCQGNDTEMESCSIKMCPVESEDENSSATIGIGAGIGSTAVVVGLLIVFIYILKRYRLRKPAESPIYSTTVDTGSSNLDLHIYDGLQQNTESPTHRQNDVTYVNTII